MKLVLLSDIHASLEALAAVLPAIGEGADRVVCLGDIVGYNADPGPCIDLLAGAGVTCIAGNHDRAVAGQIGLKGFSREAAMAVGWTRKALSPAHLSWLAALPEMAVIDGVMVAVHGALHPETGRESVRLNDDPSRRLTALALRDHPSGAMICAYGHTHLACVHAFRDDTLTSRDPALARPGDGAHYLINPGTVGQPRDGDRRASYMVVDTDRGKVALRRVEYDWQAARAKTVRAGLVIPPLPIPAAARAALRRLIPGTPQKVLRRWAYRLRG